MQLITASELEQCIHAPPALGEFKRISINTLCMIQLQRLKTGSTEPIRRRTPVCRPAAVSKLQAQQAASMQHVTSALTSQTHQSAAVRICCESQSQEYSKVENLTSTCTKAGDGLPYQARHSEVNLLQQCFSGQHLLYTWTIHWHACDEESPTGAMRLPAADLHAWVSKLCITQCF